MEMIRNSFQRKEIRWNWRGERVSIWSMSSELSLAFANKDGVSKQNVQRSEEVLGHRLEKLVLEGVESNWSELLSKAVSTNKDL